jgi:hypothetical protein
MEISIVKTDEGDASQLQPPAAALLLAKSRSDFDTGAGRDGLNVVNSADDRERHVAVV